MPDFDCIDSMREAQGEEAAKSFCLCVAFECIYRARRIKGVEDIDNAIQYLKKYREIESGENCE